MDTAKIEGIIERLLNICGHLELVATRDNTLLKDQTTSDQKEQIHRQSKRRYAVDRRQGKRIEVREVDRSAREKPRKPLTSAHLSKSSYR